jgi:hypothetical protein
MSRWVCRKGKPGMSASFIVPPVAWYSKLRPCGVISKRVPKKLSLDAVRKPVRRIGANYPSGKCNPLAVSFSSSERNASLST